MHKINIKTFLNEKYDEVRGMHGKTGRTDATKHLSNFIEGNIVPQCGTNFHVTNKNRKRGTGVGQETGWSADCTSSLSEKELVQIYLLVTSTANVHALPSHSSPL